MSDATADAGGWSPERSAAGGHNPYLIAVVVSIATFMEVLDTTIANVARRHIAGGLAVGIDESTYVITSYLVANAIVLAISGWLSTVIGRKKFYMICVGIFTVASLLCGFALVAIGLGSLEFVLDEGQRKDWFGSTMITTFAIIAAVSLLALIPWELTRKDPIIDLRLLGRRQFGACFLVMLGTGAVLISTTQMMPQL
ncbi:MAG: EmrB/QacA family drug resistance transporter, partial [Tardiphaga sp.]